MIKKKRSVEKTVRDIRRQTREKHSPEEKIRSMLEGLRGEESIAELRQKEGLNPNLCYRRNIIKTLALPLYQHQQ